MTYPRDDRPAGMPGAVGERLARWARWGLAASGALSLVLVNPTAVAFAVVLLGGSLLVARFARPWLDAAVAAFFLAHALGTWVGYANLRAWGPILHFCVPVLVAMVLALGLTDGRIRASARTAHRRHRTRALVAGFIGSIGIVVAWEVLERLMTLLPGVEIQTDRGDTITDMQLGALGTLVGLGAALLVMRRERSGDVTARPATEAGG